MKRGLFIIIFLAVMSLAVQAQDFIDVNYSLTVEWIPTGAFGSYEWDDTFVDIDGVTYTYVNPRQEWYYNTFRNNFMIEAVLFDYIFIGGAIGQTFSVHSSTTYMLQGNPMFTDALFKAGLRFEHIEIGFERFCNHPVVGNAYAKFIRSVENEVSFGKVYIRIGGEL